MTQKPLSILINQTEIPENDKADTEGWTWKPLDKGGVLTIRHENGNQIAVLKD
jgi:hypothetical protein